MSSKTAAELVIDVTTNAERATAGLDAVGDTSVKMSRSIDEAGETAEKTARRLRLNADATDELGGKAGMATGALGALTSGFDLVGLGGSKYADALGNAALATDFLSGVGDSLTLVLESTSVKTALAKVQTIGHAVATGAATAATGAQTAAQWALNAALNANPIALVVLAVVALVAGLVLAYKHSETVRNIVNTVGREGREAVGWVVDKVTDLVGWFRERVPGALSALRTAFKVEFAIITAGPRLLLDIVTAAVSAVRDGLPDALEAARKAFGKVGDVLTAPFKAVKDVIDAILAAIGKIHLPKLPKLPGFGRVAGDTTTTYDTAAPVAAPTQVYVTVSGAIDPYSTAQQIREILARYDVTFALASA